MDNRTFISFYLRSDSIHIFVKALRKIGNPRYVRFLINGDDLKMVMQPHDRKEFISFRVPASIYGDKREPRKAFQVRSRAFCALMAARLEWDTSLSYRVPGEIYPNQKIVRYDLNKAIPISQPLRSDGWQSIHD